MITVAGKRAEIGLGALSALSLASARTLAFAMREMATLGKDPRSALAAFPTPCPEPAVPTFWDFAQIYIDGKQAGWKNPTHRLQWRNSLRDHAAPLHNIPVDVVSTDQVVAVLHPIWLSKAETASRVRGRIERILDAAKAKGLRPKDSVNPAAYRGHLEHFLPDQKHVARSHHAALPWAEAPAFMKKLRLRDAPAARCLEFVILTAARSGEALGASWSEINIEARLWTVPGARMKAGKAHSVPLSSAAMAVLEALRPEQLDPALRIFNVNGIARSNMAMAMLLRRMGYGHITVHGFRSTFRDWAGDETTYPRELIEGALAHVLGDKAERSYRRGTAIDRRRLLMEDWSILLTG